MEKPIKRARRATYRDAGVDIDAGNALVRRIAPLAARTVRKGSVSGLGGFAALFDVRAAGYADPLLVAATDGVGTKLRVAIDTGRLETVGIDLVAMCANDLVVQGAEPLFFLDYFATGALDVDGAAAVIAGIAEGCAIAGCALIGGETAEMPGMYADGDFDLAGFCVGAVERDAVLTGETVRAGDTVLGLASSGLHSNGFSLVRRLLETERLALDGPAPFKTDVPLGAALLAPTRIYVKNCLGVLRGAGGIKALAHITGGGLIENIPRVLPAGLRARLDARAWPLSGVFRWLKAAGAIDAHELARTFNCGIGMVCVVERDAAETVAETLRAGGETVYAIGVIEDGGGASPETVIDGTETAWRA